MGSGYPNLLSSGAVQQDSKLTLIPAGKRSALIAPRSIPRQLQKGMRVKVSFNSRVIPLPFQLF